MWPPPSFARATQYSKISSWLICVSALLNSSRWCSVVVLSQLSIVVGLIAIAGLDITKIIARSRLLGPYRTGNQAPRCKSTELRPILWGGCHAPAWCHHQGAWKALIRAWPGVSSSVCVSVAVNSSALLLPMRSTSPPPRRSMWVWPFVVFWFCFSFSLAFCI